MLLTIPVPVNTYVCSGVGSWGYPYSIIVSCITFHVLSVLNNIPNSNSSADYDACFSILHTVCVAPLIFIDSFFIGIMLMK